MKGASGETINPYCEYPQLPKAFLPLRLLSGQCSGPCVVIAGGPSARRTLKRAGLPSCFAIAVNHAAEQFPTELAVCQDQQIFKHREFRRAIENRKTFLVTPLTRPTSRLSTPKASGFYYWREASETNSEWQDHDPCHVLRTPSVLSGSQAVVIAHALGFAPIVCLGFDASRTPGSYSYGFTHPKWGGAMPQTKAKQSMIDRQCSFLEDNAAELDLVNCSDGLWASKTSYGKVHGLIQSNSDESRSVLSEQSEQSRRLIESVWLANMDRRNPTAATIYRGKSELRRPTNAREKAAR